MQLYPTKTAVDLTLVAIVVMAIGLMAEQAAVLAWGGATLLGLMIARGVTLLSVDRVRNAGFEMLWQEPQRVARIGANEQLELRAEVRNRDDRAARYVGLRSQHSPHLRVELDPVTGEVPAGGRLAVTVRISSQRVGRHGLYGLSLEVRGSPGLYEVPLTFANPFGVEVLPASYATRTRSALGGRSRSRADLGSPGRLPHGSYDLREIREYRSGDPFKRLAWKATARRGRLMVREFDLEERDVVWIVLDASVELWSGLSGRAPLDVAIESSAALVQSHLERGNQVGLAIVAARKLAWIPPGGGAAHAARLMEALCFQSGCHDADRSGLDEADVALRVLEHLRPLEPKLTQDVRANELDKISRRANIVLPRAPLRGVKPLATAPREALLRQYLVGFGLDSPPRLQPDRPQTDAQLVATLEEVLRSRPRPSIVVVSSPLPDPSERAALLLGLGRLPQRHCRVRWLPVPLEVGLSDPEAGLSDAVRYATSLRALALGRAGTTALRRVGVRLETPPRRHRPPTLDAREEGDVDSPVVEEGSAA